VSETFLDDRDYQSFLEALSELNKEIPFLGEKRAQPFSVASPSLVDAVFVAETVAAANCEEIAGCILRMG